jgi:DNA-binding beta-propeller fold protein YncE
MKTSWKVAAVSVAALVAACQMATRSVKAPPLDAEGEVWAYLQELPSQATRLDFTVESLAASRADGQEFPLRLAFTDVSGKEERRQRLLATGRLPPGEYAGFSVRVKKATLASDDGSPAANLLVPTEAVKVAARFTVSRARARVVTLSLQYGASLDKGFGFRPAFTGAVPSMPLVELLGFATATGSDAVTAFDKQSREVVAVLAAGRDPKGLVVDRLAGRLFVALSGGDEVAAYDIVTGEEQGRARLQPGDRPQELGLSTDRRTLVVTNPGSNTVAFVDAQGLVEVGRTRTGLQPTALLMDRQGRRAYAFNQGGSSITIVDVGSRAAAGTITTSGAPARGAFSRSGDRLYVVSPSSAYMDVYAMPTASRVNQVQVGFNAVGVHVDPRTDYVYVSMGDGGQLQLFAPLAPLPVSRVELPGPATFLAIDNAYDRMFGVVPDRNALFAVDVTSRRLLPLVDTGEAPYGVAVVGERN